MSGNQDPLKDWIVAAWRDIFGDSGDGRRQQVGEDGRPTRIRRFTPLSPIVVAAAVALYAPRIMSAAAGNETVVEVLT
ncbi:AAA family ATPase, partial [Rhodococcus sp. TAF43]